MVLLAVKVNDGAPGFLKGDRAENIPNGAGGLILFHECLVSNQTLNVIHSILPHDFFQYTVDVGEVRTIVESGKLILPENPAYFILGLLSHLWMMHHLENSSRNKVCRL